MAERTYNGDPKQYDHLVENGYEFHLKKYINEGWDLFNKNAWGFFGFAILSTIITSMAGQVPGLGVFIQAFVGSALTAGFFIVANKLRNGESTEFGDFFKGFDDIQQLGFARLIIIGIVVAIMGIFAGYLFISTDFIHVVQDFSFDTLRDFFQNPEILMSSSALIIPMIYISVAYMFTVPFIVLGRMGFWNAMETSRKVITRNFFNFLLMSLTIGLISIVGLLIFGIGVFATQAVSYCIIYAAYMDIAGHQAMEMDDTIEEIGDEPKE